VIVELAVLTIKAGCETEFEALFPTAVKSIAQSPGCLAHELRRSVETPQRFALRIEWATLEDHTQGFRGSPAFAVWRGHVEPFLATAPSVEHFRPVAGIED
jgi:heme-degrading monooxygenase HmoA